MKTKVFFTVLFVIGMVCYSCNDESFSHENDFEKSYDLWLKFKAESNDSYIYTTMNSSWSGHRWETTITVASGEIIRREFILTYLKADAENDGEVIIEVIREWVEEKDELNTHDEGMSLMTLDEVYDKAKKEWLQKRKGAEVFFETKNNGLMSLCGYVENGCMDDCFIGISIEEIKTLQ